MSLTQSESAARSVQRAMFKLELSNGSSLTASREPAVSRAGDDRRPSASSVLRRGLSLSRGRARSYEPCSPWNWAPAAGTDDWGPTHEERTRIGGCAGRQSVGPETTSLDPVLESLYVFSEYLGRLA